MTGSATIPLAADTECRRWIGVMGLALATGKGCAPIRTKGAVGIRGDNAKFTFKNFTVSSL